MLTVRDTIKAALAVPHAPTDRLYTNGDRLAWLPQPMPGWYRIGAADVRDAYEDTDRTAGCCDMEKIAS